MIDWLIIYNYITIHFILLSSKVKLPVLPIGIKLYPNII
jgi:hypothetical protein